MDRIHDYKEGDRVMDVIYSYGEYISFRAGRVTRVTKTKVIVEWETLKYPPASEFVGKKQISDGISHYDEEVAEEALVHLRHGRLGYRLYRAAEQVYRRTRDKMTTEQKKKDLAVFADLIEKLKELCKE